MEYGLYIPNSKNEPWNELVNYYMFLLDNTQALMNTLL